jgi:hypothetical protein
MNDHFIPEDGRFLYISNAAFKHLRMAEEWAGCDSVVEKMMIKSGKGYRGDFSSFHIITVPASFLPEGTNFLAAHKDSVILAQKMRDGKIHQDPPGISGHLLEGRYNYDAFVVDTLKHGVYVHKNS